MPRLITIAVRAILWRRWASLGLFLTGTVTFAVAGVAPLWSNAAEDSLIARSVTEADPRDIAVIITSDANSDNPGTERIPALALEEVREAARMSPRLEDAFGPPQVSLASQSRKVVVFRGGRVLAPLMWRAGGCSHLALETGRCPEVDTETVLSDRTARVLGATAGDTVTLPELGREPVVAGSGEPFPTRFRVVGIYRPPDTRAGYWAGSRAFDFIFESLLPDSEGPARTDALFTTQTLLTRLDKTQLQAEARRTLTLTSPRADDVDSLERDLSAWAGRLRSSVGVVTLDAPALQTLVGLGSERGAVRLSSYLLGLQLLILAWYVLFLVVASAGDARSHELVLAKLRGLRTSQVTFLGLAEPLILVAAAAPLGLGLAGLVTRGATDVFLSPGISLRGDVRVLAGAVVAFAGAGVATALGLRRLVDQPVLDQLRRAVPASGTRRLVAVEVLVVTLAGVALYQVGSRAGPGELSGLALLAPGLAALAVAVLAGRVLRVVSILWARLTRFGPGVAGFLASRQIGRRSGGTRVAVLATVAVSLATFAAGTWEIAERQRAGQAAMEVGAAAVYRVSSPSATKLLNTVRQLDPSGRELAAAVQLPPVGAGPPGLAIDATRLGSVTDWQPEWSGPTAAELGPRLRPPTAESLTVRGRRLSLAIAADLASGSPEVALVATLLTSDGRETTAAFGRVRFGEQVVDASVRDCARSCRLTALHFVRAQGQVGGLTGRVDFLRLDVDGRPIPDAFGLAQAWRPARLDADRPISSIVSTVEQAPVGLRMAFNTGTAQNAGMVRADVPEALPVLVAGATSLETIGRDDLVFTRTLGGDSVPASISSRVVVLPRLGPVGTLVDLELVSRLSVKLDPDVTYQVWASGSAPGRARLTERLEAAGLRVLARESREDRAGALERTGPALALILLLGVAVAGLGLAVFAVLASALVQGRRRAFEFAALRTAGVSDHALRQAMTREYAGQLGIGGLFGLLSGWATAGMAGPAVSVLGLMGPLAPGNSDVAWTAMAVVGTASTLLFGVVAWVCARMGLWLARPELLRAGPA